MKKETKNLKSLVEEWMSLERRTLAQRRKAEEFYETNLMEKIVEEYLENNKDQVKECIKYLIVSVGTSYEPIVLNISLLNPEKVCFLYTNQSETILDKVADFCNLKVSQIEKRKVGETETLDIYREIKRCYLSWNKPDKLYIDFTGGTKAMSTAAAMAGGLINVQMIYCGTNNYLSDFRKPFPGSERLFFVANPIEVFGDLEVEKAFTLFDQYNYSGVCDKLEILKDEVPDPVNRRNLNLVYMLAKTYEAWDALDFKSGYERLKKLNKEIKRDMKQNDKFIFLDFSDELVKQEWLLMKLSLLEGMQKEKRQLEILSDKEYIYPLMFTMLQNAYVREKQEKYDMATLLLYRLLEMIEQRRLSVYNLYASKMNYSEIVGFAPEDSREITKILREKTMEYKKALFGKVGNGYLPEQVSLLEGFIILATLGDPIVCCIKTQETINKLKRIRAMVSLRNNSIFAHGLAPVKDGDFIKFKVFVVEMLRELCRLDDVNFSQYEKDVHWFSPTESKYVGGDTNGSDLH